MNRTEVRYETIADELIAYAREGAVRDIEHKCRIQDLLVGRMNVKQVVDLYAEVGKTEPEIAKRIVWLASVTLGVDDMLAILNEIARRKAMAVVDREMVYVNEREAACSRIEAENKQQAAKLIEMAERIKALEATLGTMRDRLADLMVLAQKWERRCHDLWKMMG